MIRHGQQDPFGAHGSQLRNLLGTHGSGQCITNRRIRQAGIDDVGDGGVQRLAGTRQPFRLQVAADQRFVGQIKQRRPDDAMDHPGGITEEVLVMGTARGAVSDHQCRLAAAAGCSMPRTETLLQMLRFIEAGYLAE